MLFSGHDRLRHWRKRAAGFLDGERYRVKPGPHREAGQRRLVEVRQQRKRFRRRAIDDRSIAAHDPDHVSRGRHALEPVFRQHDRESEIVVEPVQRGQHFIGTPWIELAGRFVEHKQVRTAGHRSGNRDALALTARERRNVARTKRSDAEQIEHLFNTLSHLNSRESRLFEPERDVVFDESRNRLGFRILKNETDVLSKPARPMVACVDAKDARFAAESPAGEMRDQSVQTPKQRRFSASGWAGHDDKIASPNAPGHRIERQA